MSSMFIITDPEDGKDYDIELSPDELKRMKEYIANKYITKHLPEMRFELVISILWYDNLYVILKAVNMLFNIFIL